MFNKYENITQATIDLLKLLQVRVTVTTVKDELQNHPDFPSLLCISDAMFRWNVFNAATGIETNKSIGIDTSPACGGMGVNFANNR